jgi:hypothetical protein
MRAPLRPPRARSSTLPRKVDWPSSLSRNSSTHHCALPTHTPTHTQTNPPHLTPTPYSRRHTPQISSGATSHSQRKAPPIQRPTKRRHRHPAHPHPTPMHVQPPPTPQTRTPLHSTSSAACGGRLGEAGCVRNSLPAHRHLAVDDGSRRSVVPQPSASLSLYISAFSRSFGKPSPGVFCSSDLCDYEFKIEKPSRPSVAHQPFRPNSLSPATSPPPYLPPAPSSAAGTTLL